MPLVFGLGRRGQGQARSQDIGLAVLVPGKEGQARSLSDLPNFSVKEKDETRPLNSFSVDSLNAFIRRFAGV